jgi:hypothetical protein
MSTPPSTARSQRPFRYTTKNLYNLLPAIYRERDAGLGNPLEAVLAVIAEQVRAVEQNIDNLYEDWFIETCYQWAVPYLGDLLGARLLNEGLGGNTIDERAYVGNTIGYRRRKGTVSMLEELSANITGWPAKVVEFFELLETTQYLNHVRPANLRTPDIRNENSLDLIGTPFDCVAHSVEVRHIDTESGRYNIPDIGIFLYRLTAFPVQNAPAYMVNDGCFKFNALGLDEPLFNNPDNPAAAKTSDFQVNQETNMPVPIRRLAFFDNVTAYYSSGGQEESVTVMANNPPASPNATTVSSDNVTVYDLSGWWRPPAGSGLVAVDPKLGRLTFASDWHPTDVHVSYWYGFSDEVGGGFYERPDPDASVVAAQLVSPGTVYRVEKNGPNGPYQFNSLSSAISKWSTSDGQPPAIFEIEDSEVYQDPLSLSLPAGISVEIRAAQGQRPVLKMAQPLAVSAAVAAPNTARAGLMVNGLVFAQTASTPTAVSVGPGDLGVLNLRQCTLVPAGGASLSLGAAGGGTTTNDNLVVTMDHTITGGISIDPSVSQAQLVVQSSVVDANGGTVVNGSPGIAIDCYQLTIEEATVLGGVQTFMVNLASNTIFMEPIISTRRQVGCVRFCYLPVHSRVPRPYKCQPNYPEGASISQQTSLELAVKPEFTSTDYGDPGYAQLSTDGPAAIFRGADNGAEMGAFNELLQALRIDNLSSSMDEYLRFGLEAGIFLVT